MNFSAVREKRLFKSLMSGFTAKWVILGVIIGIIAGLGSIALYFAIDYVTKFFFTGLTGLTLPTPGGEGGSLTYTMGHYRRLLIPVSTVLGGLISAFIVYRFAPETEGHGTDAAIAAVHKGTKIRPQVPIVKLISSAVTIGSGGSAGREGPTAQIASGYGSFVADVFHMNEHDRRIAMAAGIGAGIGSIFLAPFGGALLSTEILYKQDFEVEALIPSIIASIIGYTIFGYVFGYPKSIFIIPGSTTIGFYDPTTLLIYVLLGLICGVGGIFYAKFFYFIQALFTRMRRVSKYLRPAIGAFVAGVIGIFFPQVLGLGYGFVQLLLGNALLSFPFWFLIIIFLLKVVATSFTIGSGGSGGVFGPGMVSGAFLSAAVAILVHPLFPSLSEADIIIVGMIAFFGGISKAPISVMIMGSEMTAGFPLLLPLMLTTAIAYFVSGPKNTIYKAQYLNRAASPAHKLEYQKPVMEEVTVYDAMERNYGKVSPEMSIRQALSILHNTRTKGVVVEKDGVLEGYLSLEDVKYGMDIYGVLVRDMMTRDPATIKGGDDINHALAMLTKTPSGKLIVIDDNSGKKLVLGTIGFSDIAEAYDREIRLIKARLRSE